MRGLKLAIGVMTLLIVVGVAVIGVTIVRRLAAVPGHAALTRVLAEPPGTRIAGIATVQDRLAVLLQGGGPDRVVLVNPASGTQSTLVTLPAQ